MLRLCHSHTLPPSRILIYHHCTPFNKRNSTFTSVYVYVSEPWWGVCTHLGAWDPVSLNPSVSVFVSVFLPPHHYSNRLWALVCSTIPLQLLCCQSVHNLLPPHFSPFLFYSTTLVTTSTFTSFFVTNYPFSPSFHLNHLVISGFSVFQLL